MRRLSPAVIHKVLVRHELNVLPRRKRARHRPKRYSRPVPGDRVQMDVCKIRPGLYQFTALKRACLRHCQTPLFYFMHRWRKGHGGAFLMGLSHGLYCLGCCWVLMGLLFYGGVMELHWIIGLALNAALVIYAYALLIGRQQRERDGLTIDS